jgi:hypothetical protein
MALTSGCRCTTCAPSASVERIAGPHKVRVEGQASHEWGIDGFGAPHVGGVLWPTVKGAGYAIHVVVDGRPKLFVDAGSRMPSKEELQARVDGVEVVSAPDHQHLGVLVEPAGDWRVVHLLPRGVPFESAHSTPGKEISWAVVPPPVDIAMAEMRDERCRQAKACKLLWSAVRSQAPGPPLDDVLLELWPDTEPARAIVIDRARPAAGAPAAWRSAAAEKALIVLEQKETRPSAFGLVIALEEPGALARMDRRLVEIWKAEGTGDSHASFNLLESRLSKNPKEAKGPTMAPAERAHVVATARELLRDKQRTRDCGQLLVLAGSPEDLAWMDDALLELWPFNGEICALCDGAHEVLERRARGSWGPPVRADWRERATDKAATVAAQPAMITKAGRLLLAIDTDRAIAIALENWLRTWPADTREHHSLMKVVERGPASWKQRAVAKSNDCIDRFATMAASTESWKLPDDERWRATHCIDLLVTLEGKSMSCERWREVARLAKDAHGLPHKTKKPERCTADGG